jgi:hypothetical protein
MRRIAAVLLLFGLLVCGNHAFAEEAPCECEKGGIGLIPSKTWTLGCGVKVIHSGRQDCITAKGINLVIGGVDQFVGLGVGYDTGVVGIGIAFKGKESMVIISPLAIGYDYGRCPVTWPIHME